MKQLYHCSAKCDESSLRSYSTYVWNCSDGYCRLRMYRSSTTYQHYYKYLKWLRANHHNRVAEIFECLYSACMTRTKGKRSDYAIYNLDTGEVNVFYSRDEYKDYIAVHNINERHPL